MAIACSPQPDLHRILRRLDFPQSAKEALACLGRENKMLNKLYFPTEVFLVLNALVTLINRLIFGSTTQQ